jgi:lipopolysaccharide heptosyltransferase II
MHLTAQHQPKTTLILRFSSAGDVLLTAPAVEALAKAWPNTQIIYVTKAIYAPLLAANPFIHRLETLSRGESLIQLVQRLRCYAPDAILDLHGKARSMLIKALLSTPYRATWHNQTISERVQRLLGLRNYRARSMIVSRYHTAVEQLVGRSLPACVLQHYVRDADRREAQQLLQHHNVSLERPIIGMSPGALWQTKRWPKEYYATLASKLLQHNYQVVLCGSGAEADLTAWIAQAAPGAVDLQGQLSLSGLGGLLEFCSTFIANDSGPMHMARALRIPTLAIFGSTDPAQFDFTGQGLLYKRSDCSPCSSHGRAQCPKGHFRCMSELDVQSAWQALQPLLKARHCRSVRG